MITATPTHHLVYNNYPTDTHDAAVTTWNGRNLGLFPVWWTIEGRWSGQPDTYLRSVELGRFELPSDGQSTRCVLDDESIADAGLATTADGDAGWYTPAVEFDLWPIGELVAVD